MAIIHITDVAAFEQLLDRAGRPDAPETRVKLRSAAALREILCLPLPAANCEVRAQTLTSARTGPDAALFVSAWEQEQSLTWEQTLAYATKKSPAG